MVTYPEIGERFVKSILKTIFGREFKHLSVTAQKVLCGSDSHLHGARLDVYTEPEIEDYGEERAAVYDIEPDCNDSAADKKALPRRMRFYHGKIAARSLNAGADYDHLKNVVIIMIMPYDPFGRDHMLYTIKNKCVELPEMEYEDGASTLFLYTKGTKGIPSAAVKQLLYYMENTTYENAVNEELREIHRMVETVKNDREVDGMRIKIIEENYELKQEVTRQAEKITEQADKIIRQAEENTKQADEITKQAEENAKQEEEIKRLREELKRRDAMDKSAKTHSN
ncbi:MAG: hypothetical protein K2J95_03565 [Lachnospiraceae bacterium]|nr:hypothetical protein [Lachnospiraceae bacterium]